MSKVSDELKKRGRTIYKTTILRDPLRGYVGEGLLLKDPALGPVCFWGYVRVSTDNQLNNNSLEKQAAYCYGVDYLVWEVGSGFNNDRPGMYLIRKSMTLNQTLVTLTLDRWSRSASTNCSYGVFCLECNCRLVTSLFYFNSCFSLDDMALETHNFFLACTRLEDNYDARQAGINKRKKRKKNYPGRKLKCTKALYKKYVALKKKNPTWVVKQFIIPLKVSRATFYRMLSNFTVPEVSTKKSTS